MKGAKWPHRSFGLEVLTVAIGIFVVSAILVNVGGRQPEIVCLRDCLAGGLAVELFDFFAGHNDERASIFHDVLLKQPRPAHDA